MQKSCISPRPGRRRLFRALLCVCAVTGCSEPGAEEPAADASPLAADGPLGRDSGPDAAQAPRYRAEWVQVATSGGPGPREGGAMAYDEQSQVVTLVGGGDGASNADLWQWNGSTWSEVETTFGQRPWQSRDATMVYSDSLVYVDPRDDTFLPATVWSWADSTWSRVDGLDPFPSVRRDHALAADLQTGELLLFGGHHIESVFGDTWTFAGGTWTDRATTIGPEARRYHDMVYDEARQEVVLFGGNTSGTTARSLVDDTWIWDGSTWSEKTAAGPLPFAREGHGLVYDSNNELVILFGGVSWSSGQTDTWVWDGTSWFELLTDTSPPARRSHSMAFDASRGVTVVYGGFLGGSHLGDVWELRIVQE